MREVDVPHELRGRWRVEEEFIGAIRGREQARMEEGGGNSGPRCCLV